MMKQDEVVAALVSSTAHVFSTMLDCEIEIGEPRMEVNPPGPSDGIIAVIGMAGTWVGTASLTCDSTMACSMSSSMLGTAYPEVNDLVLDAVSEIANMIFGNFKTIAELQLGPLGLSIPTVIYGLKFWARTA